MAGKKENKKLTKDQAIKKIEVLKIYLNQTNIKTLEYF